MNRHISSFYEIYKFNEEMIEACLNLLEPNIYHERINNKFLNPIGYSLGHITLYRNILLEVLGNDRIAAVNFLKEYYGTDQAYSSSVEYPHPTKVLYQFKNATDLLYLSFENLEEAVLLNENLNPLPTGTRHILGYIAFYSWHESYHLGQIGSVVKNLSGISLRELFYKWNKNQK